MLSLELFPPLSNYLAFGADVIAQNQEYKDMLFDYFFTVFETKRLGQMDKVSACKLMESILLYLPGRVDNHLYQVLDIVRAELLDVETYKKRVYNLFLLEIFVNAIYYNPVATLQYLEHCKFLQRFFELWFQESHAFLRVHDKTLSIQALMKIVQLPTEHIPTALRNEEGLKYVLRGLISFFKYLPDAIKRIPFECHCDL